MRTLIFLLFSVSIFAQEFNETIVVHDLQYQVVDRQFNHVFDDGPKQVDFYISHWYPTSFWINTNFNRSNLEFHYSRQRFGTAQNELPYLRYYVNGGIQKQTEANGQTALIPFSSSDTHMNFQWEWRGIGLWEDGTLTGLTDRRDIGRRWQPQRN